MNIKELRNIATELTHAVLLSEHSANIAVYNNPHDAVTVNVHIGGKCVSFNIIDCMSYDNALRYGTEIAELLSVETSFQQFEELAEKETGYLLNEKV